MAILPAKLIVTGLCFWYLVHTIDIAGVMRASRTLDLGWTSLAVLAMMLQVPLFGSRWHKIVDALGRRREPIRFGPVVAIAAISNLTAQVVPNIAADTARAWMLTQLGRSWGQALISVMIDRAVGIAALVAVGLVTLLFPSALSALGGQRGLAIAMFGAILAATLVGLLLAPAVASILERWRYTRWAGNLARAAHYVLLGSRAGVEIAGIAVAIHGFTILAIWLLGKALGLALAPVDAAVLFTLMVAVSLIPISIGGWGVRELAVTALLSGHGVSAEQALFFSVCFGLTVLVAALPGALIWAVYSPRPLDGAAVPTYEHVL
jgi:uncharacterized membrane protein YbhN (UPF0104 family)